MFLFLVLAVLVAPIVLEEQCDRGSRIPMGTIQRQFKDIGAGYGPRDLDSTQLQRPSQRPLPPPVHSPYKLRPKDSKAV
jgi:hypothetical protein